MRLAAFAFSLLGSYSCLFILPLLLLLPFYFLLLLYALANITPTDHARPPARDGDIERHAGQFFGRRRGSASVDDVLREAERLIAEGADIIDIGGESTRPGSSTSFSRRRDRSRCAGHRGDRETIRHSDLDRHHASLRSQNAPLDAGAEIINDISGLSVGTRRSPKSPPTPGQGSC